MLKDSKARSRSSKKSPIIVIGLDSCDPDLVELWSKEGRLPFITTLMELGVWTRLHSTADLFFALPWVSFSTGVNPAKHGFYYLQQLRRFTTEIIKSNLMKSSYPPFWACFRNTGKKISVFDVPKTFPIAEIEGIQITGWGEFYPLLKSSSLPQYVLTELTNHFGKYPMPNVLLNPKKKSQVLRSYKTILSSIDSKLQATKFILGKEEWDLFISVFAEPHFAGHQFYHHFDKRHWAYKSTNNELGDSLKDIYIKLDSALSEIYGSFPNNATLFVISVHGIKANYSGNHLLPSVLERLGFQIQSTNGNSKIGSHVESNILKVLRELIPSSIKDFINNQGLLKTIQDKLFCRFFSSSIDWKRSSAFYLPSGHFQGFISVNLRGREPWGIIEPGDEYNHLCTQISQELKLLINPITGKSAIREVVQTSHIFQGENLFNLPDLVVQWAEDGPINQLSHPSFGIISKDMTYLHKAQHTSEGFMIAAGKHINEAVQLTEAHILDLAPTFLYLMGEPIPDYMDGRILLELIDEDFKRNNEVKDHRI